MKKLIYILLCIILGLITSFVIYVIGEILIIFIMVNEFFRISPNLTWDQLMLIRFYSFLIISIIGIIVGLKFGFEWWKYIYVDKKYRGKWFKA
ncbi:MAG: hypothetical protein ABIE43_03045 [Patescibacteria group bacterium]